MKSRLLSHIAFKFAKQPENVANESLCFILNSDDMAPKKLLSSIGRPELAEKLTGFLSEMSTDNNGRPDLTGIGKDGGKPLIIEGKFWASLTDNQPDNYLKELDEDGVLMFVCPEKRASRLKDELEERTGQAFEYKDNSYFELACGNKTILIVDWIKVLTVIEEYASLNNTELSNDAQQLKALCSQMDDEGFLPLSFGDINEYHGRLCYQLSELVDSVRERIKKEPHVNVTGLRATAWKLGYGFYFRIHTFTGQLYFSAHRWYSSDIRTPYWLGVRTPEWKADRKIYDTFNARPEFKNICMYDDSEGLLIAIPLKVGLDQEQIISHIALSIDAVATVLDGLKADYPTESTEDQPPPEEC